MMLVSGILLGILLGLGMLIGDDVIIVMFVVWLFISGLTGFFFTRYIGYLVKAGHIAVITDAVRTGIIPENQPEHAFKLVRDRFGTADFYYVITFLIKAAVRQLQHIIANAGNRKTNTGFLPNIIFKLFISIALDYVDMCCLGNTIINSEQNVYKSAADGVVLYYQNQRKLMQNTAVTAVLVIVSYTVCSIVLFWLFLLLFGAIFPDLKIILSLLFAGFLSYVIKYAFIDSWLMIKTVILYIELASRTRLSYDLYGKLSSYSNKFKELSVKGQIRQTSAANSYPNLQNNQRQSYPNQNHTGHPAASRQQKPVFCSECGSKNKSGVQICGNCGSKIG